MQVASQWTYLLAFQNYDRDKLANVIETSPK